MSNLRIFYIAVFFLTNVDYYPRADLGYNKGSFINHVRFERGFGKNHEMSQHTYLFIFSVTEKGHVTTVYASSLSITAPLAITILETLYFV